MLAPSLTAITPLSMSFCASSPLISFCVIRWSRDLRSDQENLALLQMICDIYLRYLFEKSVIEHRKEVFNNADGFAEAADLPAPDAAYSLDAANTTVQPYALYRIEAALDGWQPLVLNGVQVFDAQQTVARLNLLPAGAAPASAVSRTGEVETDIVTIPPHTLFAGNGGSGPAPEELLPGSVLNRIVVPKKITVHLGKPSANVRNVTVSFQSYIANVASSEVYPTWDSAPGTRRTSI